jgi:hypothetical protein
VIFMATVGWGRMKYHGSRDIVGFHENGNKYSLLWEL